MNEIVIVSGKGGTGKTSLSASFAAIAAQNDTTVFADCDVDAADLHLIFAPEVQKTHTFISGREAHVREEDCIGCGKCAQLCRYDAIIPLQSGKFQVDETACEGCGVCVHFCPAKAIDFEDRVCGEWYVSSSRFGTLVHAQLNAQAENSGRLVSVVRNEAHKIARETGAPMIITDGPPGTGCPVIASITGANAVVVVTEPTLSGKHDLQRVLDLAHHFRIPAYVCVNKFDINPEISGDIRTYCEANAIEFLGEISFDKSVTAAQIQGKSLIEYTNNMVTEEITNIWTKLQAMIKN